MASKRARSRYRPRGADLALMAGAILVALALGETAVRLLRPQFAVEAAQRTPLFWRRDLGFYRHDPEIGWSHVPGAAGAFARTEFSHRVRINGAGWRDRERTPGRAPGVPRIVVLGDSFTWGHGVEDDEVFSRRMEALMPGVEVLNMGLSGSSTDQQLLILRRAAPIWRPDLVLVLICRNDFDGILSDRDGPYPKPLFELEPDGALRLTGVPVPDVPFPARLNDWARRRSALWNLTATTLDPGGGLPSRPGAAPADRRRRSYDLMRALLAAMKEESAAAGAAFAAVIVPSNVHTYFDAMPPLEAERRRALEEACRAAGIPLLDLVPAFRAAARDPATGGRIDLHYRLDQHWNRLGHEVAAAELKRQIALERLLSAAPGV